ncbi:MAG: hypothetical protein AAF799_21805 [Myxococcota bacterium]
MPLSDRKGGTGEVVAQSRRDDRSGLIDIRALSSLVEPRGSGSASASSVALPSFSSPWTMQDTRMQSRAVSMPAAVAARPQPARDDRPLYLMIAALSAAVVSLGAYAIFAPSPTRAAAPAPEPAPSVAAAAAANEAEPEPEPALPAAPAPSDEAEPEPEVELEAKAEPAKGRSAKNRRNRKGRRDRTPTPAKGDETKPPAPADRGGVPIGCVLDPDSCSKKKRPDPTPTPGSTDLPDVPSNSQIRSAMKKVKPTAKACASGADAGQKVRVKLSVTGRDGRVVSAKALEDHAGTALGRCVAGALSKATLPRFAKPQAGIVFAVRM